MEREKLNKTEIMKYYTPAEMQELFNDARETAFLDVIEKLEERNKDLKKEIFEFTRIDENNNTIETIKTLIKEIK